MSLLQTVTSGGCFAFIYLFTYGKQVTNSIGRFFLSMQSVLLLHCPLISAGGFKLSLAFIETRKTEHLFLLLPHFTACASCFWHLALFLVREASALVMSCLVVHEKRSPWGEEQFASTLCVWGQRARQSQHEWHWARLVGRSCLQDELMLVKCWYFVLTCLVGNVSHMPRSFLLSFKDASNSF